MRGDGRITELTILITTCGARTSPDLIDAIKNNGEKEVKVVGIDPVATVPGAYLVNKFIQTPTEEFIRKLSWWNGEKIDYILPCGNEDCLFIAAYSKCLPGIKVVGNRYGTLDKAFNKVFLYNAVSEACPECAPKWGQNFVRGSKYVIKPITGRGGRGVYVIDRYYQFSLREKPSNVLTPVIAQQLLKQPIDDFIIMEYLPGDVYSVYCLCWEGKTLFCGINKRIYGNASNTLTGVTEFRPDIYECVKALNKYFNFSYNVNYEFALDEEGKPKLFDCNPRLAASTAVFRSQGFNLPWLSVKLAMGEFELKEMVHPRDGWKFARYLKPIFINPEGGVFVE